MKALAKRIWAGVKTTNIFSLGFLAGFVCGGAYFATNMILGMLGAGVLP